ncbi:MAG: DNA-directed RNA polymerase subunit omega [Oscillospiraceae bacterium]|nr:DNA-directed RNA polymerase subunit omega [Oscillospiraceae bacterium]
MPMTSPSIIDLLGRADCRYTLVVDVSKRARQLVGGAPSLISTREKKPLAIAIDEINSGVITYDKPPEEE